MPHDFDGSGIQERTEEAQRRIRELAAVALEEIQSKLDEVEAALIEGYSVDRIRALEVEIKALGRELAQEIGDLIDEAVQEEVDIANEENDDEVGTISMADLTAISRPILDRIADQLAQSIEDVELRVGNIGTDISNELRGLQLELLTLSTLEGEGLEERAARIREAIESGRADLPPKWRGSVEAYAEMVARTNMAEAARATNLARGLEAGLEVFQVSVHGALDSCGPYEGRLFSTSGTEPNVSGTLADVLNNPGHLFKPNCRHTLLSYDEDFASERRRRAIRTDELPSKEELKKMDYEAAKLKREQNKQGKPLVDEAESRRANELVGA